MLEAMVSANPMTSEHNGEPGTVLSGSAINPQYEHQS
jgi:hypothetical protein